jgi:hypothetical protein
MVGAVVGTPGALPTNWTYGQLSTLTTRVVAVSTENGINYIDIQISGTATATPVIYFEANSRVVATNAQTWATSVYVKQVGGSTTNISALSTTLRMSSSTSTNLGFISGTTITLPASSVSLSACRFSSAHTTTNASTAYVMPALVFSTSGAVDITLRIGMPQLEQAAFATSVIATSGSDGSRAADLVAINTLSPWYNSTQGTLFAQFEASPNTYTAYVDISNGVTAQNSIHIDNDSGLMRAVYYSGSSPVAILSLGSIGTVGTINKVATSYAVNDFRANRNGGTIVSYTPGALPVGLTQMNIGTDPSGTASNVINGHIQRITYYPRSMADYELQTLTS